MLQVVNDGGLTHRRGSMELPSVMIRNEAGMNPSDLPSGASRGANDLPEMLEQPCSNHRLELVGRLTAMVLHEMRNPLSVIKGYAEMIARDEKATGDTRVKGLLKGVDRLDAVMNCVLSVVRKPQQRENTTDVEPSVRLAQEFVTMAHRPKPMISVQMPEGLPPAELPATDLEQVILNLLMNACDATDPHPKVTVSVSFAAEGPPVPSGGPFVAATTPESQWHALWPSGRPAILIAVRDEGAGITPEVLRLLFNEQITTKQHSHGTGLGLLLCRDVLTARRGTLLIESTYGVGTTATVIVPAIVRSAWTREDECGELRARFA